MSMTREVKDKVFKEIEEPTIRILREMKGGGFVLEEQVPSRDSWFK